METPQQDLIRLGHVVASLREAKNLSLGDLAAASGLEREFIGDVEVGRIESTVLDLVALSKALNVTTKELLELAGL
jgi:transcriptional regulator with XRE-family HTH domain